MGVTTHAPSLAHRELRSDRGFPDRQVEGRPLKHYAQLTQEQRYPIDAYCKAGLNQAETVEQLWVDPSRISREIRRCPGRCGD